MTEISKNKWAVILGGSSGLGLATAKKLAQHNINLIIVHRSRRSDLAQITADFDAIRQHGVLLKNYNVDGTNPRKRTEVIEDIKTWIDAASIAILVHSIAKGNLKPMHSEIEKELEHQDFTITLDAMAISLYDWTKDLVKNKLFATDTRIVSFTSEGNTKAIPNYAAVSVAKVALEAITRNIALEFAPIGIKANCIQAGIVETASLKMIPGYERIKESALHRNPNKKLTTPEDVANAVYLLTMEEAKWITGTVIKVDGGESLQ
ncbi:SDR family oxidoreductase [Cellulophaga baltica]|uniref:NAD(P)-dependent dehydrogenase, short-chain alcohol dehydrogenase family n=1 Tax=Cellulophaga baltica TaxID=76594 RepID=A0A1G7HRG1_9FLAO|nr:SDR family oxidoreductase [Cellulophaga baltica]SDF03025.1 NAD(P)-dependent dehydrogenase, short-chain alcohol dehydrogenase family [Cellulophaga baltica]